ncbi:MAG: 50S ribosomal protein L13 [Patescibacteria group bacterium]
MKREIYKIDATEKAPGRLAAQISMILQGKNKPDFNPSTDMGGIVHIENVGKMKITGAKMEKKEYFRHSGYPGGLKRTLMKDVSSEFILKSAVLRMLPRNRLKAQRIKRLIFI